TQMHGHIADRHALGQLEGIPLKSLGVAPPGIGEGDLDRTHPPTGQAFHAGDGPDDEGGSGADGYGAEASLDVAPRDHPSGAAGRAPASVGFLANSEDHLAILILGADVLVAPDAEGRVQEAGGHTELPVWVFGHNSNWSQYIHFSNLGARFRRMNL